METPLLFVGILLLILIGILLLRLLNRSSNSIISTDKITELEKANAILLEKNKNQQSEYERFIKKFELDNETLSKELKLERENLSNARQDLERYRTLFKNKEDLSKEFEQLANKILEEKTNKISEQNKLGLENILNPLQQRIKDFEEKVDKSYKSEAVERNSLKGEIKQLVELNKQISEEANQLARALKGNSKQQGNWGEFVLERILEASGLIEGESYTLQGKGLQLSDDHGNRLQPDVIIHLPDEKHIVIDSKVSLIAYEKLVNSENDLDKDMLIKQHITSIKNHISGLSMKNYQDIYKLNSPDFVLLFIPIESSFSIAVQHDRELFDFAWDKRVVIVTPSTLLATLKTVSSIWKQERFTKNALEIATRASRLYDKFSGFISDLQKVGVQLDKSKESYDVAFSKLTGKGNLINRVAELEKLGVKVKEEKRIDPRLIDDEDTIED